MNKHSQIAMSFCLKKNYKIYPVVDPKDSNKCYLEISDRGKVTQSNTLYNQKNIHKQIIKQYEKHYERHGI